MPSILWCTPININYDVTSVIPKGKKRLDERGLSIIEIHNKLLLELGADVRRGMLEHFEILRGMIGFVKGTLV